MGLVRGIVLILFGLVALYRAHAVHNGRSAWLLPVLGLAALALGIWHVLMGVRTRR
jgi:cadmium resistance protein CadD (predicted permease)